MSDSESISPDSWLDELETQIALVREAGTASSVHQMRVAAGRMSVWLELGGRMPLRDDLRWLRRTAMRVRDADVMLATPRTDEWHARLAASRALDLLTTRRALATSRPRAILLGLACVPWPSLERGRSGAERLARRALRAGDGLARDERDSAPFHRLRRRVRRTRYALEWLGEDAREVKQLQDALGLFNDASVEIAHWRAEHEQASIATDREAQEAEQERLRREVLAQWASCRRALQRVARRGES